MATLYTGSYSVSFPVGFTGFGTSGILPEPSVAGFNIWQTFNVWG